MNNITLFEEYAARILAELYSTFPVKRFVDAREVSGHSSIDDFGGIIDENGQPSKKFEIAIATIEWLADNRYIVVGSRHVWGFEAAVLTQAGLATLNASPDALNPKDTFGARLARFTRQGALGLARETMKAMIPVAVQNGIAAVS